MKTAIAILFVSLLVGCQTAGNVRQSNYFDVCRNLIWESPEWTTCVQRAQILEQRQQIIDNNRHWQRSQAIHNAAILLQRTGNYGYGYGY